MTHCQENFLCTQAVREGVQDRLWVLKENAHRGQGVVVLPEKEAVMRAISERGRDGGVLYEMSQAYIGNQLTVAGRKFYLRWASASWTKLLRSTQNDVFCLSTYQNIVPGTDDEFFLRQLVLRCIKNSCWLCLGVAGCGS